MNTKCCKVLACNFFGKCHIKILPQLDSLASSHPVSMPVQDPKEIEAIFDTISYKKVNIIIPDLTKI